VKWTEGAYNGGRPVFDYELDYEEVSSGTFSTHASDLTDLTDIITSLTPSTTYKFRVRARNIIGYSDYSAEV
jgi:hypothetical protein